MTTSVTRLGKVWVKTWLFQWMAWTWSRNGCFVIWCIVLKRRHSTDEGATDLGPQPPPVYLIARSINVAAAVENSVGFVFALIENVKRHRGGLSDRLSALFISWR